MTVQGERLIPLDLQRAKLSGVDAEDAFFDQANLAFVDLSRARVVKASFKDAILQGALFIEANVRGAVFDGADLRGADFTGAKHLVPEQLRRAIIDETTKLPMGIIAEQLVK